MNMEFLVSSNSFKKERVKELVSALKNRNDFEAEYRHNVDYCPKCLKQKVGNYYYKIDGESEWTEVEKEEFTICNDCLSDEEWEEEKRKEKQERIRKFALEVKKQYFHLPEQLKGAGFKNFNEVDDITANAKRQAILYVKEFLEKDSDKYNMVFQGSCGTGKSHLCAAIARTLKEKGAIVAFMTTGKLLSIVKETYQQGTAKTEAGILRDLKSVDLLILDDLGAESTGKDDWKKSIIFEIVDSRLGKATIYTSNLIEADLEHAVGSRVYSRLYDNTKFIDLFTDDYRKKLQL